jgi:deoxyribodipyrimidine photo-lyase
MTTPHESFERALVWLRRDLRLSDHTSLLHALRSARQVWVAFIFDSDILCALPRQDRRVEFLVASVHELNERLHPHGSALLVRHGSAREELPRLAAVLGVQAVYCSHDDEPFALARDAAVAQALREQGAELRTVKDHVIFERSEVLTQAGRPYTVFTPYKRAWLARLKPFDTEERRWAAHAHKLAAPPQALPGSAPTCQAWRCPPAKAARKPCCKTLPGAWATTASGATSRPPRARATCPPTCVLAPCPSARPRAWRWPRGTTKAHKRGCLN